MFAGKSIKNIRVRFAPSPTGWFHIGSARTALYNWLFARKNNGFFVLRVEDTDVGRSMLEYETNIYESMRWLGLDWDEGVKFSQRENFTPAISYKGEYGPYRQSERKGVYKKYLQKLLDENKLYYCFCTVEELEAQKQEQMIRGEAPRYSGKCAQIAREIAEKRIAAGESAVLRFRMPIAKKSFHDLIKGKIIFDTGLFGDIIVAKDVENPLYNFAAVIDDYEMNISHVIRGEEHISNTPKQILLAESLGFEATPIFAHLPLILAPDRSKMSKRYGAVTINEYRENGYIADALVNFIALLGWHSIKDKEVFTREELIKEFALERVQKSGAIFDNGKLQWMNAHFIKSTPLDRLVELAKPFFSAQIRQNLRPEDDQILQAAVAMQKDRAKTLKEIPALSRFLFEEKLSYGREVLRWKNMSDQEITASLDKATEVLQSIETRDWRLEVIQEILMKNADPDDRGRLLWPLRVALSGQKNSPPPFEIAAALGKEKTLQRIKEAKNSS